jgi:hypothetical protein
LTDVSEVLTASIIRAMMTIVLMMEAVSTSKTSVNFYESIGSTSQNTVIFILAAVRI